MALGEQLYFGLVVLAFLTFMVALAVVSASTNRHMRRNSTGKPSGKSSPSFDKAA